MYKILIADDEKIIREPITDYLSAKDIGVCAAKNGRDAVEFCNKTSFDLVILDVMMPVMNGLEACKEIRRTHDVPILFLTALSEERDFLGGYRSGCDDYITKPFPLSVLYEKCISMIKRYKNINEGSKIVVGGLTVDIGANRVFSDGVEVRLSKTDFELLAYLVQNRGMILNRELILTKVWGYDFEGETRVVDTHIKRLRKVLGENAQIIKTVFGMGYTVEK